MRSPNLMRLIAIGLLCVSSIHSSAQEETAPAAFSVEEIDQMMAPIALYPDDLLSMLLMASTYPVDVAAAAEWSAAHPDAKGDEALSMVESEIWDPSVKSLVACPEALATMAQKPEWVQMVGDAFLAQPDDVFDSIQHLRDQADAAGSLESNDQQNVVYQEGATAEETTIIIESSDPEVVYVPSYNPTDVYGEWGYPSYPPYYLPPPPGYYWGAALGTGLAFTAGIIVGDAIWGDCDWGGGDIDIDVDRYNNINIGNEIGSGNTSWNHNAENRRGTPYREGTSRESYGKSEYAGAADRGEFRGYESSSLSSSQRDAQREASRSSLEQRTGVDTRTTAGVSDRSSTTGDFGGDRGSADLDRGSSDFDRGSSSVDRGSSSVDRGSSSLDRSASSFDRGGSSSSFSSSSRSSSAFSGASSPSASRSSASRGSSSMSSARSSGFSGGGGASRGGGGGRR